MAVADPVNLKEFIKRPEIERLDAEFQTHRLRSYLVDILNRQRKSITGPILKSRQEITEDILTRKSLREYLADYAAKKNIPLYKVNKKAAGYIKEIAANYNLRVINFASWLLTWIFKIFRIVGNISIILLFFNSNCNDSMPKNNKGTVISSIFNPP